MIMACSTLIICAMLAMRTRSACRAKMFRFSAARIGVTQAVLLDQEARIAAGQRRIPAAPFVHHQRHFLLRIVLVHDGRMLVDQTVHLQRGLENLAYSASPNPTDANLFCQFTTV